jgi:hypothetical protein
MALAKHTGSSGGFGRRGVVAQRKVPANEPAPQRRGTVSPRPEPQRETTIARPQSLGDEVATSASRGKAYVKALLAGTTTFIAALFMLTGVDNRFFEAGPMLIVLAVPILPTLGAILYIPAVVLSDVARLLSIPRGWADLGIGFVLGIGLGIAVAMSNPPGEQKSLMMVLAMTAGGLMGGFAFWRAQGYPGTSSGTAAAFDHAYDKLN